MEPIALTEEILYKNTYDEVSNTYHVYASVGVIQYYIGGNYVIRYYPDRNVFMYEGLYIKTVDELQQLMNLMHLDKEVVI